MNAGFISGIWYSTSSFFIGDTIRIYSAMQNNSGYDILGTISFYDGENIIGSTDFSVINNQLIERWIDWKVTPGTHNIYARITNPRKSEIGKEPEPITLENDTYTPDTKTATIDPEHLAPPISPAPETATASPASGDAQPINPSHQNTDEAGLLHKLVETVQKITDSLLGKDSSNSTVSTTTLHSSTTSSNTGTEPSNPNTHTPTNPSNENSHIASSSTIPQSSTGNPIGNFIAQKISEQKEKVDERLAREEHPEPISLFAKPLASLRSKAPFLAIPKEYVPSGDRLLSWLFGILIFICETWWLLLIVFLLLLRWIWKIFWFFWRRDRD